MAANKTSNTFAAIADVLAYSIPFLFLFHPSPIAWFYIVSSHFLIDAYRLAVYVVYAKNLLSPPSAWVPFSECSKTGYNSTVPDWLAVWLLIIADNTMHLMCNAFALRYG